MIKKLSAFALSFIMLFSLSGTMVSATTDDDYSDSIFYAGNIGVNQDISAVLNFGGDHDVFKFIAPVTGSYTIFSSGNKDTCGYLYNSNGFQVGYNDDGDYDSNFLIRQSCKAGEVYYVRVCHYNNVETGSYTLRIDAPNYSSNDDHGSTWSTASYILPLTKVVGRLNSIGDNDYFCFQVPTTGTYTISTTGTTDTYGYIETDVTDSYLTLVGEDDDSGIDTNFSITKTLTKGKNYYVRVTGCYSDIIGNYVLNITQN